MKRYLAVFVVLLLFCVVGCSDSKREESLELDKEIVGTWESTKDYDQGSGERESKMTYTFKDDGTYTLESSMEVEGEDGSVVDETSSAEGQYTIEGDELSLKATKINGDTVDEELRAVDDTESSTSYESSTPSKDTVEAVQDSTYTVKIDGDTLTLTLGATEYEFTKVN